MGRYISIGIWVTSTRRGDGEGESTVHKSAAEKILLQKNVYMNLQQFVYQIATCRYCGRGPRAGVKVRRNAPERRSGARKFRLGAFRLQNYLISQPERTFLGPASYSNIRYSNHIISHSSFTFLRSQIHIVKCFYKISQNCKKTLWKSCLIHSVDHW